MNYTRMRHGLTAIALALAAAQSPAATNELRVEYKCHFVLVGGQQVVRYITGNTDKLNQFKRTVPATLFAKDGRTQLAVEQIKECVKATDKFNAYEARELDKKTLS